MQALQKASNLLAPKDSIASNGPISIVSILSNSILPTTPKVKMVIATVPAKVPSEKINAAIVAIIIVGSVLTIARRNLHKDNNILFLLMLELERIAIGKARVQPIIVPNSDILIVSISGPITLGRKLKSG